MSTSNVSLISVVDDDQSLVESIGSLLESIGYSVAGFFSAKDFLNSPQLRRTACLILDVRMPEIGGLELQRRLTAENIRTPIIFMTAGAGLGLSAEGQGGGAVAFLRKPFSQESLITALRSALAQAGGLTGNEDSR